MLNAFTTVPDPKSIPARTSGVLLGFPVFVFGAMISKVWEPMAAEPSPSSVGLPNVWNCGLIPDPASGINEGLNPPANAEVCPVGP